MGSGNGAHDYSNRVDSVAEMTRRATRVQDLGTTIFTEMTALAQRTGAINLGQGFPDEDGPGEIIDAAVTAMRAGHNQYAPLPGVPELREAIAAHQRDCYGLEVDPGSEVLVTFGATEAIAAAVLGLCDPGDEVLVIDPSYDSYAACVRFAGATARRVALHPPDFALDADALRAAVTTRTRALIVNTPHNPTGRVFTRDELQALATLCIDHDLIAISDEVYEHLTFDDTVHIPIASLPGMRERTLTVSSLGKTFSLTGWKTGWATGPAELVGAAAAVKQFLTFAGGTPLQHAAAAALALPPATRTALATTLQARRDALCDGLAAAGLNPIKPQGTYFINADVGTDGAEFCRELPQRCGIVAIPTSVFYEDPGAGRNLVRFAFCKRDEVIADAVSRLKSL